MAVIQETFFNSKDFACCFIYASIPWLLCGCFIFIILYLLLEISYISLILWILCIRIVL